MSDPVHTILMIATTHPDDFDRFTAVENGFIALFPDHGLVLRNRFRNIDSTTEVQVIDALHPDSLLSYLSDPRREALRIEFETLRIEQRVVEVNDLT